MSEDFIRFIGVKSRITTGQVKQLIIDSEDKYLRALFTEILFQMTSKKIGWMYLTWRYSDMGFNQSGGKKDD